MCRREGASHLWKGICSVVLVETDCWHSRSYINFMPTVYLRVRLCGRNTRVNALLKGVSTHGVSAHRMTEERASDSVFSLLKEMDQKRCGRTQGQSVPCHHRVMERVTGEGRSEFV